MGHSCSKQQQETIELTSKDDANVYKETATISTRTTSSNNTCSLGKMAMRYSYTADFPIFDGTSIAPDSPWGAFISQGIDDDYSESEDAEILDAVNKLKCMSNLVHERSQELATARRRPSIEQIEEEVAKRHSMSSLDDINEADLHHTKRRRSRGRNSFSSLTSTGSIPNEEEFIPASRRFS